MLFIFSSLQIRGQGASRSSSSYVRKTVVQLPDLEPQLWVQITEFIRKRRKTPLEVMEQLNSDDATPHDTGATLLGYQRPEPRSGQGGEHTSPDMGLPTVPLQGQSRQQGCPCLANVCIDWGAAPMWRGCGWTWSDCEAPGKVNDWWNLHWGLT